MVLQKRYILPLIRNRNVNNVNEIKAKHKKLCEEIKSTDITTRHDLINRVCETKTVNKKFSTFDEALEYTGIHIHGEEYYDRLKKQWETSPTGLEVEVFGETIHIPKEVTELQTTCDLSKISKENVEKMEFYRKLKEIMGC